MRLILLARAQASAFWDAWSELRPPDRGFRGTIGRRSSSGQGVAVVQVEPLEAEDPSALGMYELVGRLGEGGQGVVFLARSAGGELVAVKRLHARLARDEAARSRFVREAKAAQRVARFCTAQVIDVYVVGDRPYIVSEYVDALTLQQRVAQTGPCKGAELDRLAIGTVTALAAIHAAGVVHRDFKPANVLLAVDGPRVIDFGTARAADAASMTSQAIGTPAYMAPEQLAGQQVGPAADLFAWASTMVFAATGTPAFGNGSIPAVMHRILAGDPDLGGLGEPLRTQVAAAFAKDPADRPTATSVLRKLVDTADSSTLVLPKEHRLNRQADALLSVGGERVAVARTRDRRSGLRNLSWQVRLALYMAVCLCLGLVGAVVVVVVGVVVHTGAGTQSADTAVPSGGLPSDSPLPSVVVAPLTRRFKPNILIAAPTTLSAGLLDTLRKTIGIQRIEVVDAVQTEVAGKRVDLLGVDPLTFRAYTPKPTAESDALWRNIAGGDVAVSFPPSTDDRIGLDRQVPIGGKDRYLQVRVGAYATFGIGHVDAVVSHSTAQDLGLPSGNAIIISAVHGVNLDHLWRRLRAMLPKGAQSVLLNSKSRSRRPVSSLPN
ncbi:MAG: serine/threonine protein kinase [Gemmatimonadales bacterium]|nr:serine/threonine protein kinase [Gemmatimonadales bacterium]